MAVGLFALLIVIGTIFFIYRARQKQQAQSEELAVAVTDSDVIANIDGTAAQDKTKKDIRTQSLEETLQSTRLHLSHAELAKPRPKPLLDGFPAIIAFIDIETTGLSARDRIVSLAVVLLDMRTLSREKINLEVMHRIYNPGVQCHPDAERIHGHADWTLRHQTFFSEEAEEVSNWIGRAGLVCCHNADFDVGFINRELVHAGLPVIASPKFCTMKRYRKEYSGSASLANISAQLGMKRTSNKHGALEDVFLTINIFFALNKIQATVLMPEFDLKEFNFQNYRNVPPFPNGPIPLRKRRPKPKSLLK